MQAVNRIYEIKGRKHTSPLAICVGDVPDIARFAYTEHLPEGLLHALLPGPVTVVLKRGILLTKRWEKTLFFALQIDIRLVFFFSFNENLDLDMWQGNTVYWRNL